ncbi:UNVERIFIED_CONTAM: hypothetical protein FKN15_055986 [Acipenser sinensis]
MLFFDEEKDPVPPELHILEPSKEEIVQKKRVTLVCLATNFYPDHIEITWKINGKNREDGVKTDDSATKNNDKYSISSRLRLTPREWFNPKNTFACDVKFYNKTDKAISIVEYIKAKDDSYQKSSAAAKFSYTLFISKSVLYGLLVAVLVWKFRVSMTLKAVINWHQNLDDKQTVYTIRKRNHYFLK